MAQKHDDIPVWPVGTAGSYRLCPQDGRVWAETGVAGAYLATDHAGATPRRLSVLLYDGAIRLCRQGLRALDDGQADLAADRLARAAGIITQLRHHLAHDGHGEHLKRFAHVYDRVARRLVEAGFYRSREPLRETIALLSCSRSDWNALARSLGRASQASSSASWVG